MQEIEVGKERRNETEGRRRWQMRAAEGRSVVTDDSLSETAQGRPWNRQQSYSHVLIVIAWSLTLHTSYLTTCAPSTLLRKEFIHLVKVFFCVASRSSCSCLIRPFSNPCSTRAAIVRQEQWSPLVSLQITLELHTDLPQALCLHRFEQATKGA